MNILITGASGFIASQITTDLLAAGHQVTCCVRDVTYTQTIFPETKVIPCDFVKDTDPAHWVPRLHQIDLVINCVGILYHPNAKVTWAIHYDTPKALFDACVTQGITKIIQISALGVEALKGVYAESKKAADDYLLALPISAIIIRPSLVYGRGSYGGTSLFRGLAGLPGITPVPGQGNQEFQPILINDLSKAIVNLVNKNSPDSLVLNAVSAKRITLSNVLSKIRAWLGFSTAKPFLIPLWIIRTAARVGDLMPYSPLNTTSYAMLMQHNVTSPDETKKFAEQVGFTPVDFSEGVHREPSSVQDRWHARLYFLRPLLKFSIAFIWIFTALCCLFIYPKTASLHLLAKAGFSSFWQPVLFYGASLFDAGIGIAVLCNYQPKKVGLFQIILILAYTAFLTWTLPNLWFEPFAPLAKNVPLLAAILAFLAVESNR